ncbi:hypothetical protein FRC98_03835 [Lujinxingia vulgaris]|uniref:DUF1302 domain-containing protein n=1 Tax=Lujinxingia vulgaris TaxID=2600176 RepID=A0A5C6XC57_9DELT|nr:hypothetical protein [Lujinxingia vulgaris]TXD38038.1 hypothetical protein FRC98_03835 [Lujinxingia vulgaris]
MSCPEVRRGWAGAISGCAILLSVASAGAQEILYDPENPAFEEQAEAPGDDAQGDDGEESAGGSEVLYDPENQRFEDETGGAPALREPLAPSSNASFQNTELTLIAGIGLFADLAHDAPGEDLFETSTELGLKITHDASANLSAVIGARATHRAARPEGGPWRAYDEVALDEAYVLWRKDRWRLAFGNLRTPWGSTDITRPGDVINPTDLRSPGSAGAFGATLPQLTAEASYAFDALTLSAVVVPFFKPNDVALFGQDSALATRQNPFIAEQLPFVLLAEDLLDPSIWPLAQPLLQATRRPMATPANMSGGLRATTTLANTDLGLGVFYGWDRTPKIELDEDLRTLLNIIAEDGQFFADFDFIGFTARNPETVALSQRISTKAEAGETLLSSEFQRRLTLLADGARYIGPIGVRADVAFSPGRIFYTTEFEAVTRASVFAALGLSYERLLSDERALALTLEGFWLHPFAADSAVQRAFNDPDEGGDPAARLLLFEGGYYGVAGALNWGTGLWKIDVQGGAMVSLAPGDVIAQLALERPIVGGARARLSANLFAGPDPAETLSLGGLWSANDQLALSVVGRF